ncbi:MAG: hypothetical protein II996_07870 [Oscillospiraceae bacterium]|nr:hypothetical protein [Oscillospiraceae bacterium]
MKKAISLVLAVALVLALLPSFALASDATAESYTYNFKKGLHENALYMTQCASWISTDANEGVWTYKTYATNGADKGTNASTVTFDGNTFYSYIPKFSTDADIINVLGQSPSMTLEIDVASSGTFNPIIRMISHSTAPIFDIYLTKTDEFSQVANLSAEDRIGTIDAYGNGELVEKMFVKKYLEEGKYCLTFVPVDKNESCAFVYAESYGAYRSFFQYHSFTLKNIDEVAVYDNFNFNMTSSALDDPSTVGNYENSSTAWDGKGDVKITKIVPSVLAENEDGYSVNSTYYSIGAKLSDTGISAALFTNRYVLYEKNGYFYDVGGTGLLKETFDQYAYSSSARITFTLHGLKAGTYNISLLNTASDAMYGAISNVYLSPKNIHLNDAIKDENNLYKLTNRHDSRSAHTEGSEEFLGRFVVPSDGDYNLTFSPDVECLELNNSTTKVWDYQCQYIHVSGVKLQGVEPDPDPELVAEQKAYDELVAAKNAAVEQGTSIDAGTAEVKVLQMTEDGRQLAEVVNDTGIAVGTPYSKTVKDEVDGCKFLYWTQGIGTNRKIVSYDLTYGFKAARGGTWLTAVYEDPTVEKEDKAIFYNGNGQLLTDVKLTNENALPALPSMKGYTPSHWALFGSDAEYAPGDEIALDGEMIFVAQYEAARVQYNVTCDSPVATVTKEDGNSYGSKITVTAPERNDTQLFNYWTRNGEVVSFDKTYSFFLAEDSTLVPVYADHKPTVSGAVRKIILSSDGNNLMAEFLGLDNAIEKGILVGGTDLTSGSGTKVSMTTGSSQFTVENDIVGATTSVGYAIINDNGTQKVIYSK